MRATGYHWFRIAATVIGVVALAALLAAGGCRRGAGPVIDLGPKPPNPAGTVSGTVNGPQQTGPLAGRLVEAINIETGERHRVATNEAGGFTFKLEPGSYRLEVALQPGEAFIQRPPLVEVTPTTLETSADFIVGQVRLSIPRPSPARADDGLGAPMA